MRKFALFILLFTLASAVHAQEKVFHFGPKAGLNVSDISGLSAVDARIGFHAGLQFNIRLNEIWRLQPEVYFSTQGGHVPNKTISNSEQYNYAALPIMVQYWFNKRFFVEAGPQPAVLVNPRRREYTHPDGSSYTNRHENIFDFAIAAGAGYQFNQRFGVNIRYNQGITDIRRSAQSNDQRNMVLQAGGFMYFR